jgi:hypothetical protein
VVRRTHRRRGDVATDTRSSSAAITTATHDASVRVRMSGARTRYTRSVAIKGLNRPIDPVITSINPWLGRHARAAVAA